MSKEIRSTIYMKEEMYEKFRTACNYKFGDKQGKIKKGMLMAIDFFIEVVEEEKALAKKNQANSSPEPELTGLIEEGVIESEPTHQDKPIDFTQNFDESPTLSAKSSNQAELEKTFPYEEIPQQPSVVAPQDVVEEKTEENIEEGEFETDERPEMESAFVPQPQGIEPQSSFLAKQESETPQDVVEEEAVSEDLEQDKVAKKSYQQEPQVESEGQRIVREAIEREAEASVALDHDPNLQTVTEKPQLDQDEKPPQDVVEPDKITNLAKRLAEERRKRNLA